MSSQQHMSGSGAQNVHVYGQVDRDVAGEIDRVAEQMVMPRSWVVAQILREWVERGRMEVAGQSWEDGYGEVCSRASRGELARAV